MSVIQRNVNPSICEIDVTILEGQSLSSVFQTDGRALVGIRMPADWPATVTHLNLRASFEALGANPVPVRSGGQQIQINASEAGYETNVGNDAVWAPWLQFQAVDAAGDAVVMAANTTAIAILKPYL